MLRGSNRTEFAASRISGVFDMQRLPQNTILSPRTGVLVALIAFAVAVRLVIHFFPAMWAYNATPVEAIALFGGAYFTDRRLAFIVPLAAMFVADLIIGLHWMIPVVYGCIALSVALGFGLRNRVNALRVAGFGIAGSLLFFVVVSFAEWVIGDTDQCRAGIVSCYVAAIPFLKNAIIGTMAWSAVLFGGFELMRRRWPTLSAAAA
jgi:hypothetical protein